MANKNSNNVWLLTFFEEKPDYMQSLESIFEDVVQVGGASFVVSTKKEVGSGDISNYLKKYTEYQFMIGSMHTGFGPAEAIIAIDDINKSKARKLIQRTWRHASGTVTKVWKKYAAPSERQKVEKVNNIDEEIVNLVGVKEFKQTLLEIEANKKRIDLLGEIDSDTQQIGYHTLMIGNTGTCKTTAARLFARKLKQIGVLSNGHLIETDRSGLVAEYIGQTETKTMQMLNNALGGVLYIDEAYSLYTNSENDYGHISIALINKFMEDHRGEIVIVMAGYPREMQNLLEMNSGLQSRFPLRINFPDFTKPELLQIAEAMLEKEKLISCEDFTPIFGAMIDMVKGKSGPSFGNGRFVRDTIQALGRQLSMRLQSAGMLDRKYKGAEADILRKITSADIWAVAERTCGLRPTEVVGATRPSKNQSHLRLVAKDERPNKIS